MHISEKAIKRRVWFAQTYIKQDNFDEAIDMLQQAKRLALQDGTTSPTDELPWAIKKAIEEIQSGTFDAMEIRLQAILDCFENDKIRGN